MINAVEQNEANGGVLKGKWVTYCIFRQLHLHNPTVA